MKDTIEVILFGLLGLWMVLVPAIMIMKIRYYKALRKKEFNGIAELFSPFNSEWWIAGFTWGFPILGRDQDAKLNQVRRKANSRVYSLYFIILTQLILASVLNKLV
jgi:hypothetical protein